MARSFEQIYSGAPKAAVGRLLAFRERYAPHYEDHHGKLYRVWDINEAENPDNVIVFLPSAMGHGEIWFPYMLELRASARLIAFSLPDDEDPGALADALLEILTRLNVGKMMIAANSVGGLIAQIMASKAPERVNSLALMMSGAPSKELGAEDMRKWQMRRKLRLRFKYQTYSPNQKLSMADKVFESICPEEYRDSSSFWLGYIEETFAEAVYKAQHIAINTALVPNIYSDYAFTDTSFGRNMRVLIVESEDDKLYSPTERECLRRLFPEAQVVQIGGAGQFALQLYEQRVLEILTPFIKEVFGLHG